jgi:hypothetical protein
MVLSVSHANDGFASANVFQCNIVEQQPTAFHAPFLAGADSRIDTMTPFF